MKKKILAAIGILVMIAFPAMAQIAPAPAPTSILSGQVSLSVSNSSARVALPSTSSAAAAVTIYNKGTTDAYVALGASTIVATSGGTCAAGVAGPSCLVPAGTRITFWNVVGATHVAGITASSTSTLIIYQGTGPLEFGQAGPQSGASPGGAAGGDLTGTYPNPSVASYNGGTVFGTAAAANTGTSGHTLGYLDGVLTFSGSNNYGTPSALVGTNITGTAAGLTAGTASAAPVSGITGMGAGCAAFLATPSSANLRGCLTDESGTGAALFAGGNIGAATGTSLNLSGTQTASTFVLSSGTGIKRDIQTSLINITGGTTANTDAALSIFASNFGSGINNFAYFDGARWTWRSVDTATTYGFVNSSGMNLSTGLVYSVGAANGVTKTCTVIPTQITITGGIITSVTGGTCT